MPKRLLMLMIACWMAANFAVAQISAGAAPDSSRTVATSAADTNTADNDATAEVAAPVGNISVPSDANSTMLPAQAGTQDRMKAHKKAEMKPDDPAKNPYWEPRDWTYINSSAP